MDGFLIINKNKGITSFGVCNKIKKVFNEKHVGHTGTLDPSTTGVLVVAIGKACKTLKLLEEHKKEYKTTILFGMSSDTFDMDGKILNDNKIIVDKEKVLEAIEIVSKYKEQIPPMFSAIKVNGKKMYELARKGESIELKPRKCFVNSYRVLNDIYLIDGYMAIDIYLNVSKGFYVRSFIRDVGEILGVDTIMYNLERLSSGDFKIEDSVFLDDDLEKNIISIETVFSNYEKLYVNDFVAHLVKNGVTLDERQIITTKPFLIYNNDNLLAIYEPVDTNKYKPVVLL